MIIGITGGIASGKSTISQILGDIGYRLIDADQVAKQVVARGSTAYNKIVRTFGEEILNSDGEINRKQLGEIIFNDRESRQKLNDITHPIIELEIVSQALAIQRQEGIVFLDIPLLFEAGYDTFVDLVIVLYVSPEVQLQRLQARDQIDELYAIEKIKSQMPLAEKCNRADFVIDNNGTISQTKEQLLKIINDIQERRM